MPAPHVTYIGYMLQALHSFTLCCLLSVVHACASPNSTSYFPLSDGAKWEYTGHYLPSTGGQYPVRATIRIEAATLVHGRRYYKHITSGDFTGVPTVPEKLEQVRYYRAEAGGIYFLPGNDLDGAERLAMPLPIPTGERWLSGTVEVTAESAGMIEVGGRKYDDCLKLTYRQTDIPRTNEEYYAPGVGLIKFVYINTTPPQSTIELTLEKYHL